MLKEPLSRYDDDWECFDFYYSMILQYKSMDIIWNKLLHFLRFVPCLHADDTRCQRILELFKPIILFAEKEFIYVNMFYDDDMDQLNVNLTSNTYMQLSYELSEVIRHAVIAFDHEDNDNVLFLSFPASKLEEL